MLRCINTIVVKSSLIVILMCSIFPGAAYPDEIRKSDTAVTAPLPVEAGRFNPFHSDKYRYQNMWLYPRIWTSILSCSMSFVDWDNYDWLTAGGIIASTAAFMVPINGVSADTRIHQWVGGVREKNLKYFFPHIDTTAWTGIVASWGLIFYGSGLIFKNNKLLEYISLTLEAIGVTQFYHVSFKLMMGREGPPQGGGRGIIHGPGRSLDFFPYGTPSGHIATLYTMTTVAAEYFDSWVLRIISHVLGAYYAINLMYNQQHFVSDIIWGASLGYFVGQWIVRHRSSRYSYTRKKDTVGITIVDAGSEESPGELVAYPFFNPQSRSVNLCLSYIF